MICSKNHPTVATILVAALTYFGPRAQVLPPLYWRQSHFFFRFFHMVIQSTSYAPVAVQCGAVFPFPASSLIPCEDQLLPKNLQSVNAQQFLESTMTKLLNDDAKFPTDFLKLIQCWCSAWERGIYPPTFEVGYASARKFFRTHGGALCDQLASSQLGRADEHQRQRAKTGVKSAALSASNEVVKSRPVIDLKQNDALMRYLDGPDSKTIVCWCASRLIKSVLADLTLLMPNPTRDNHDFNAYVWQQLKATLDWFKPEKPSPFLELVLNEVKAWLDSLLDPQKASAVIEVWLHEDFPLAFNPLDFRCTNIPELPDQWANGKPNGGVVRTTTPQALYEDLILRICDVDSVAHVLSAALTNPYSLSYQSIVRHTKHYCNTIATRIDSLQQLESRGKPLRSALGIMHYEISSTQRRVSNVNKALYVWMNENMEMLHQLHSNAETTQ